MNDMVILRKIPLVPPRTQWLRLHLQNAGCVGLVPGKGPGGLPSMGSHRVGHD